ncbi:hypothetical protein Ae331Ps2_4978c [Pseudonocardia sp. Ae331_Ps2]|nr:hypothetical protein Ae331Ps2_4978c [Pseudonocardia sp. Ae331_Ps2]
MLGRRAHGASGGRRADSGQGNSPSPSVRTRRPGA